jgi:hypothetical protein
MTRELNEVLEDIAREEARLLELERTREEARSRIASLRAELDAAPARLPLPLPLAPNGKVPHTPAEKVKLFRSLFRGRTDVFPTHFVSKKTGKPGYAPACSNKWEPGLCILKTGGKCSDCANKAFIPVDDQVIADHLKGRHVMGVYPLLDDDACWFLAMDFDKSSWKADVSALTETCRAASVPVAIERSRSGNGAHAWFFFSAPVPANVARRMGCYLITETMNRRHELSMRSYDRLFPNQDTMPRGGFGNLIALPLQNEPRQQGNSVVVDENFVPYTDQWAFLASVPHIEPSAVEAIAHDATRRGQVVGIRFAEVIDPEEAAAPWTRLPSRRTPVKRITGPLPPVVKGLLAQRLFIEKAGLPSPLAQSAQAYRGIPEPRVLQEAEDAPLDGGDSTRHRLCRGPGAVRRVTARLRHRG